MSARSGKPPSESTTVDSLLTELVDRASPPAAPGTWVAEVIDDRHPDLVGRIEVRWRDTTEDRSVTRWVPTTWGLPVRRGDRVMLQQPENWSEPVVVAVLDGYARRPEREAAPVARIELRKDERIEIHGHRGTPLVAIHEGDEGPVVRLLSENLDIAAPGHLRLSGRTVELRATEGNAEIEAEDDVVVRGETIHLN
jgi:hypothetical protein